MSLTWRCLGVRRVGVPHLQMSGDSNEGSERWVSLTWKCLGGHLWGQCQRAGLPTLFWGML